MKNLGEFRIRGFIVGLYLRNISNENLGEVYTLHSLLNALIYPLIISRLIIARTRFTYLTYTCIESIRTTTTTTKIYQTKINATPSARFRTARSHRKLIRRLDSSYLMKVSQLLISRSRALMIQSSPNLPCFLRPP